VVSKGSDAVWLTLLAGQAGDPSLHLKNGYAQDDAGQEAQLHHLSKKALEAVVETWFCARKAAPGERLSISVRKNVLSE